MLDRYFSSTFSKAVSLRYGCFCQHFVSTCPAFLQCVHSKIGLPSRPNLRSDLPPSIEAVKANDSAISATFSETGDGFLALLLSSSVLVASYTSSSHGTLRVQNSCPLCFKRKIEAKQEIPKFVLSSTCFLYFSLSSSDSSLSPCRVA
ncbi:uncharacterized protein A4U43_C05F4990 [Asparagus officinalis]|uniref:Uncharacterized protein n=1 Tax=Asparagus officinalis TaxID=4686 RepID=A0A5P1EQG7_ASPOF|nr:uncharacterized protein A4U43_C05F4990 [Asparagus officinalis]